MRGSWTEIELSVLKEWENLYNSIPILEKDIDCQEELNIEKSLCLEAMLCTYNKLSLGYKKGECIGIYSFIECLKQEEIANKEGALFLYHPINFSDMKEYVNFLRVEIA